VIERVKRDFDNQAQLENLADKLDEIGDWINEFERDRCPVCGRKISLDSCLLCDENK